MSVIYEHLFERAGGQRVRAGLIGTGAYGASLLAQVQHIGRLEVPVVCDRDVGAAQRACQQAGIREDDVIICDGRKEALAAIEAGNYAILEDSELLMELPLEVIVECTGNAEAGARHAESAIKAGKHVAMVTKETDSVVGPILHRLAEKAGVVYTPVDGDQHGLLIGLVSWARNLGLDVVCGGKAHARDLVYDETGRTVTDGIKTVSLSDQEMAVVGGMPAGEAARTVAARRTILRDLAHVSEADLCESVIAANATALVADKPGLHGPVARITEIPDVLSPREAGGVLDTRGAIDVVICLRRRDEAGLAGGVFVVFACANEYTWGFLKQKGIVASRQGNYGLIYRPYHLLGVETPISILCAGLLKVSTGGLAIEPRVDLVARAAGDLKAGALVEVADEGCATPLEPLILPAARVEGSNPLPLHMAAGNRLSADVPAGRLLTSDVIQAAPGSRLWALRREQESAFKIA